jgi:transcriptional regulator with XRE-family HTH domain
MFDTRKFGVHVARMRKNLDLTQAELAEKLNLTRQAISKYETGDSFPDISILIQIAGIFGISLDELIGFGNPTKGEMKILKNIPIKEGEGSIGINDLINLAPLVKPGILGAYSKKLSSEGIDISHIVSLVQYLNDSDILQVINSCRYDLPDGELLERILPFLDSTSKEAILKKIIEGESDWRLIKVLLPHIGDMAGQLEAAVMDGALPSEVLEIMHEYFLKEKIK